VNPGIFLVWISIRIVTRILIDCSLCYALVVRFKKNQNLFICLSVSALCFNGENSCKNHPLHERMGIMLKPIGLYGQLVTVLSSRCGVYCVFYSNRLVDLAAIQSVSITVDISTSALSLTDDSGNGLKAGVSQLQTSLCVKPSSAGSKSYLCIKFDLCYQLLYLTLLCFGAVFNVQCTEHIVQNAVLHYNTTTTTTTTQYTMCQLIPQVYQTV